MINIVYFGSKSSGGHSNILAISESLKISPNKNINLLCKDDFIKSLRIKKNDIFIFWMVNHLTMILFIYISLLKLFLPLKVFSVIHNPRSQPQTSSRIHNFFSDILENLTFKFSDKLLFISKILFDTYRSQNKILLSNALPFNSIEIKKPYKKTIDILFIGRNLPYKGLPFLLKSLDNINSNLSIYIIGKGVSKFKWPTISNLKVCDEYVSEGEYWFLLKSANLIIFPYSSATGCGPIAEAMSINANILAPNLDYFLQYNKYPNILFYNKGNTTSFTNTINKFFLKCKYLNDRKIFNNPYSWQNVIKVISALDDHEKLYKK